MERHVEASITDGRMDYRFSYRMLVPLMICLVGLLVASCADAEQLTTPRIVDTLLIRLRVDSLNIRPDVIAQQPVIPPMQMSDNSTLRITVSTSGVRTVATDVTLVGQLVDNGIAIRNLKISTMPMTLGFHDSTIVVPASNSFVSVAFTKSVTVEKSSRDSTDDLVLIRRSRPGHKDSAFHRYITTTHSGRASRTDTTFVGFPVFRDNDTATVRQVLLWTVRRELGRQTLDSTFVITSQADPYFVPTCVVTDSRLSQTTHVRFSASPSHLPAVCQRYFPNGINVELHAPTPSRLRASAR